MMQFITQMFDSQTGGQPLPAGGQQELSQQTLAGKFTKVLMSFLGMPSEKGGSEQATTFPGANLPDRESAAMKSEGNAQSAKDQPVPYFPAESYLLSKPGNSGGKSTPNSETATTAAPEGSTGEEAVTPNSNQVPVKEQGLNSNPAENITTTHQDKTAQGQSTTVQADSSATATAVTGEPAVSEDGESPTVVGASQNGSGSENTRSSSSVPAGESSKRPVTAQKESPVQGTTSNERLANGDPDKAATSPLQQESAAGKNIPVSGAKGESGSQHSQRPVTAEGKTGDSGPSVMANGTKMPNNAKDHIQEGMPGVKMEQSGEAIEPKTGKAAATAKKGKKITPTSSTTNAVKAVKNEGPANTSQEQQPANVSQKADPAESARINFVKSGDKPGSQVAGSQAQAGQTMDPLKPESNAQQHKPSTSVNETGNNRQGFSGGDSASSMNGNGSGSATRQQSQQNQGESQSHTGPKFTMETLDSPGETKVEFDENIERMAHSLNETEGDTEARAAYRETAKMARRDLSAQVARQIQKDIDQQLAKNSVGWKHHRVMLEDGKAINVSARQADGGLQLQLAAGSQELNKIIQQNLDEIRQHLQEQLDLDVELQLQYSGQEGSHEAAGDSAQNQQAGHGMLSGDEQGGRVGSGPDGSAGKVERERYFGFNNNEWTA